MSRLLFRVDASIHIGSGHVIGCLTLADSLSMAGHECFFVCINLKGNLVHLIVEKKYQVFSINSHAMAASDSSDYSLKSFYAYDVTEVALLIQELKVDTLVIDHYEIDRVWEKIIRSKVKKLVVIDDLADRQHCCDVLIDSSVSRLRDDYGRLVSTDTKCLLGLKYAIIRDEFIKLRPLSIKRIRHGLRNILITLGGGIQSAANILQIYSNFYQKEHLEINKVTIVLSESFAQNQQLESMVGESLYHTIVVPHVNNMAQLMLEADILICAGGQTMIEGLCMGVPMLVKIIADNQIYAANHLAQLGFIQIINNDCANLVDLLLHLQDSKCSLNVGHSLVDGHGVNRIRGLIT